MFFATVSAVALIVALDFLFQGLTVPTFLWDTRIILLLCAGGLILFGAAANQMARRAGISEWFRG